MYGSVMNVRPAKDFASNEANLRQHHVQLKTLISSNSTFRMGTSPAFSKTTEALQMIYEKMV